MHIYITLNINIFCIRGHCEKYKEYRHVKHKNLATFNWNKTVKPFKETKLIYMHTYLLLQY